MSTGKSVDRSAVAAQMILSMDNISRTLHDFKDTIIESYREDCITLGMDICLVRADGDVRHGKALDIDEEGALIVDFGDGVPTAVSSGEVSVRGMYGYH